MKPSTKQPLVKRLLSVSILTLTVAGMISTANAQYANLHNFAHGDPYGSLTHSGRTSDRGVVFKQMVPEPTVFVFALIVAGLLLKVRKG